MDRRKNYYKISKKGDFIAKSPGSNSTYRFEKGTIKDLKQRGSALIVTELDGTHTLHIEVSGLLLEVMSDISSYQYLNGTLLLRQGDCGVFIIPDSYQYTFGYRRLDSDEEVIQSIFGRNIYIREDFSYLEEKVICNADGVDYIVINRGRYSIKQQVKIIKLGKAEIMPGNNGCIRVTTDEGIYIRTRYSLDEPRMLYDAVDEFEDKDYPEIFPKEEFYGYWCKDLTGILKMAIYQKNETFSYILITDKPAKNVTFVKRVIFHDTFNLDIWKVVYVENDEEKYFLTCKEGEVIIDPKELM